MKSKIRNNYLYNVVYQILTIIIPLVTTPYISRVLGAEKIGIYSYRMSIAQYFIMFSMLGIVNYGQRTCAAVREDKQKLSQTFFEIYSCQIVTSIVSIAAYIILLSALNGEQKIIGVVLVLYILSSLLDISWFFYAVEEFKIITIRNTIIKFISVFCIFTFVKTTDDLWKYAFIMSLGTTVGVAIYWPLLHKWIRPVKVIKKNILKHIKPVLILFVPVVAVSLYRYMDKIMLGNLSNMTETGYYENAEKLVNMPLGFINALGIVMLPRMSNLLSKEDTKNEAKKMIEYSMLFVCFLSCGMVFGISAVSSNIIKILMGEAFAKCSIIVKVLSISMIFFSFANVIRTQYLIPQKKDKSYIISVFGGAIVNLCFNCLLIPRMQSVGAAVGTVMAEFTVCIVQTLAVEDEIPIRKYIKRGIPFVFIGGVMYMIVITLPIITRNIFLTLLVQILVGIVVYGVLSIIYIFYIDRKLFNKLTKTSHT